jgi:hypothetical protein
VSALRWLFRTNHLPLHQAQEKEKEKEKKSSKRKKYSTVWLDEICAFRITVKEGGRGTCDFFFFL